MKTKPESTPKPAAKPKSKIVTVDLLNTDTGRKFTVDKADYDKFFKTRKHLKKVKE